jgi:hypothetical protein
MFQYEISERRLHNATGMDSGMTLRRRIGHTKGPQHMRFSKWFQQIRHDLRFLDLPKPNQYGPRGFKVRAGRDRCKPRVSIA